MKRTLLIGTLLLLLCSCTFYTVERGADGITKVSVKSTRSFEAPDLHYERIGQDARFDFKAANADNNTDAIMGMVGSMMGMMQEMMTHMYKMQIPPGVN